MTKWSSQNTTANRRSMSRTLVSFIHGIGDNIMFTGVLAAYRAAHPDEQIDLLLLNAACGTVWNGNPDVSAIHLYPHSQPYFWSPLAYRFRDLPVLRRHLEEMRRTHGFSKIIHSEIQTLPEILYHLTGTYGGHKVQRIAREFGLPDTLYPYRLFSSEAECAQAKAWVQARPEKPLFVIHPFSGHALKSMPVAWLERLHALAVESGRQPVIVGGPGDLERIPPRIRNDAVTGWSFGALLALLKQAQGFAGVDSSIAHLAAAADVSKLVITSPKLRPERYLPLTRRSHCEVVSTRKGWSEAAWLDLRRRISGS